MANGGVPTVRGMNRNDSDSRGDRGGSEEPTQAYLGYVEESDERQRRYTREGESFLLAAQGVPAL